MNKEELIRNLKYTKEKHKNDFTPTFGTNISLMCDDILNYLEQEQRWIPCSEGLPNIHNRCERYYVTLKSGDVDIAMFTECNGEHWWNFNFDDVIAWQYLPEPYVPDTNVGKIEEMESEE